VCVRERDGCDHSNPSGGDHVEVRMYRVGMGQCEYMRR
jgi:hypothetical protein